MSSLGEAFSDADEILTLIALIPVILSVMWITINLGNPNFEYVEWTNSVITSLAHALVPAVKAIVVLGVILWVARNLGGR